MENGDSAVVGPEGVKISCCGPQETHCGNCDREPQQEIGGLPENNANASDHPENVDEEIGNVPQEPQDMSPEELRAAEEQKEVARRDLEVQQRDDRDRRWGRFFATIVVIIVIIGAVLIFLPEIRCD